LPILKQNKKNDDDTVAYTNGVVTTHKLRLSIF